jgi:hypothetical protein
LNKTAALANFHLYAVTDNTNNIIQTDVAAVDNHGVFSTGSFHFYPKSPFLLKKDIYSRVRGL